MSHHYHRSCTHLSKLFCSVPLFLVKRIYNSPPTCQGCYLSSQIFPQKSCSYCSHIKTLFCPLILLKLTPGQVLNISHLGSMENARISVVPLHSYSRCEKYHGFHREEVLLAKHRLFPSLRAPWTVHDVTDQDTRQNLVH